jgi:phosphoribosylformylglycinamidine synthase
VLHVFNKWDVPATPVGKVIREKVVRLNFQGHKVLELELEFLTAGPMYCRPCSAEKSKKKRAERVPKAKDRYDRELLKLLSSPNICNRDWVIRQYDHEVRASTVIKPLQGKLGHSSHGDAAVLKPVEDSFRGLGVAVASNPYAVAIDPYRGGKLTIDETCRNLAAVGAVPHSFTDCLNFGNPEKPDRLWLFKECVRGMGEVAAALNIPIPSGNVSLYNETVSGAVLPTPTVLGCGIVSDIRRCVTTDLKHEGNVLAVVGSAKPEMGASEYYRMTRSYSNKVPDVDIAALKAGMDVVIGGIERGAIVACHDISDGGLAVALAEMCIGGDIGADIDVSRLGEMRSDAKLFSEGPSAGSWSSARARRNSCPRRGRRRSPGSGPSGAAPSGSGPRRPSSTPARTTSQRLSTPRSGR